VDLLGKTHYTERASLNAGESFKTLKVADMPKGVYIVTLTNGNDSWAKKFVKE
jgi:hypothetical protein